MSSLCFVAYTNPCLVVGPDEVLGELTDAFDKEIRVAYNAPGEGSFKINTHSEQYEWVRPDLQPYIRVFRDTPGGDLLFGFFVETGADVVVSSDEEGGEVATRSGRGSMAIIERAVMYNETFLTPSPPFGIHEGEALAREAPDGFWSWMDRPPAGIMVRQLEEAQARGGLSPVTWTFTRELDSDGNDYDSFVNETFKVAMGTNLLDLAAILGEVGVVFHMSPDFVFDAWDADDAPVETGITFEKGVNIRESADREWTGQPAASHVLVQGDDVVDGLYRYNESEDDDVEAQIGRREVFFEYHATGSLDKLGDVGHVVLERLGNQLGGPVTLGVLEREDEFPFLHYNPGDLVSVNVDTYSADQRVWSIGLVETAGGEYDVIVELQAGDPFDVHGQARSGFRQSMVGGSSIGSSAAPDDTPDITIGSGQVLLVFGAETGMTWSGTEDFVTGAGVGGFTLGYVNGPDSGVLSQSTSGEAFHWLVVDGEGLFQSGA